MSDVAFAAIMIGVPLIGIMWAVLELCSILSSGRVKVTFNNRLEVTINKPKEIEVTFKKP